MWRANVVGDCGFCGTVLTFETQHNHNYSRKNEAQLGALRDALRECQKNHICECGERKSILCGIHFNADSLGVTSNGYAEGGGNGT